MTESLSDGEVLSQRRRKRKRMARTYIASVLMRNAFPHHLTQTGGELLDLSLEIRAAEILDPHSLSLLENRTHLLCNCIVLKNEIVVDQESIPVPRSENDWTRYNEIRSYACGVGACVGSLVPYRSATELPEGTSRTSCSRLPLNSVFNGTLDGALE